MKELLNHITQAGIIVEIHDGELKLFATTEEVDSGLIEKIKVNKEELFQYLISSESLSVKENKYEKISKCEPADNYPLSRAQMRLWLASQTTEGSIAYNMPNYIILNDGIDIEVFQKAIMAVIDRHEVLRTIFRLNEEGEVRQFVIDTAELDITIGSKDFSLDKDPYDSLQKFILADASSAFNLSEGPLLRIYLLRVTDNITYFYYNMHHIISDAWSNDVLAKDTMKFYESFVENKVVDLPPLRIQYKDYATWQLEQYKFEKFKKAKDYWSSVFEREVTFLDLPTQKKRPKHKTFNGRSIGTRIAKDTVKELNKFSNNLNGSVYTGLLAALKILLYRYTGETDILIGNIISGRDHFDLEDQIGFYINVLPIRSNIDPSYTFVEFYKLLDNLTNKAREHQSYPYDQIIADLNLSRNSERGPLLDIFVNYYHNTNLEDTDSNHSELKERGDSSVRTDIEFNFTHNGDLLNLIVNYNKDIYDHRIIQQFILHYKELLNCIVNSANLEIGKIDYLRESDRRQLLFNFNSTATNYPYDNSIIDLFSIQALRTPDNVAIVCGAESLTYSELDKYSNQLAYLLSDKGILKGSLVCISLNRSIRMMVGILGVLKAGAAYIPIDPSYPKKRLEVILNDTDSKFLVTEKAVWERFKYQDIDLSVIWLDEIGDDLHNVPEQSFNIKTSATDLAYVMYTSGSMGLPKGVMVEQRSVIRLVKSSEYFSFDENTILLSTGSFSFDATIFEYWGPLLNGGRLVLTDQQTLLDSDKLKEEIVIQNVNTMWFTAGWFNQLIDTNIELFSTLSTVLAGGDRLSSFHINKLLEKYPEITIINGYGPTENTTFSLTYSITKPLDNIPIGYPISNSTAYIMNEYGTLQPIGVPGEICLGGDGLSRGYLNRPELDQEKFFINPYKNEERLYRTGDLGRWLPDGCVEFIGRIDNQIKIRGFRIELGEIEAAISDQEGIDQCAVLAISKPGTEKQLVAYLVANTAFDPITLHNYLKEHLPEYMIPKAYVTLSEMPLTRNGKIDREKLPAPDEDAFLKKEFVEPSSNTEIKLAKIWSTLLGIENIGVDDNFFELGGHSMLLTKLSFAIANDFGVKIELNRLFAFPTLLQQGQYIDYLLGEMKNTDSEGNEEVLFL